MIHRSGTMTRLFRRGVLLLYFAFLTGPLYILVMTAIKPGPELFSNPLGLPHELMLKNFTDAFVQGNLLRYSINSFAITFFTIMAVMAVDIFCSYGLYKLYSTKIGTLIFSVIIAGLMVPATGIVTTILLYKHTGLYNHPVAVVIAQVAASVPLGVMLLVGFMKGLPKELEESAVIDGCGDLQTLIYIIFPSLLPAISTVVLFNCILSWNNLYTPLILLPSEKFYTLPVGLLNFRSSHSVQYNLTFAAVILTCIPLLALYLSFQKNFVDSLAGSVKG